MGKIVTVGVKLDQQFISLLRAEQTLGQWEKRDTLTPSQQLALMVLAEARGFLEAQVHACILPEWRPHIEAVHELRKVETR